jgi:hypothetical protein
MSWPEEDNLAPSADISVPNNDFNDSSAVNLISLPLATCAIYVTFSLLKSHLNLAASSILRMYQTPFHGETEGPKRHANEQLHASHRIAP